jgi:acetyl esterase/lipase
MNVFQMILVGLVLCFIQGCATKKFKDICYLDEQVTAVRNAPTLNVFMPKKSHDTLLPVLVFVHGGYWTEGNKNTYGFLGRNFARKGVVTIIAGYTLSPYANYDEMAHQIASVVRWAKENIDQYKGDPSSIFVSGHSAGGHLVSLIATNPKYLSNAKEDISGVVLIDAAGLDMYSYLQEHPPTEEYHYLTTWTDDPIRWKDASPLYHLSKQAPPFAMYLGKKSYDSIIKTNQKFFASLQTYQPEATMTLLNKKHVPMIKQFIWPFNDRFEEIKRFMEENR